MNKDVLQEISDVKLELEVDKALKRGKYKHLNNLVKRNKLDKYLFDKVFKNILSYREYDMTSETSFNEAHYDLFLNMMKKADFRTYVNVLLDNNSIKDINNILMTQSLVYELKYRMKKHKGIIEKERSVAKKIIEKLRDREMDINAVSIDKESPNLVEQLLSLSDNESFLIEFQELIYKVYGDVVTEALMKDDELLVNFPLSTYRKSMERCKDFIRKPNNLNLSELTNDIADFMIIPLYVTGHCFAGYIRKLENGEYSMTAVNLGARPFENGSHSYMEFVYDNAKKLNKLINRYGYCDFQGITNIDKCYKDFKMVAKEYYTLKTDSRLQKTGNCFTKNPEKAVRYGLSLILESINNPSFKPEDIRHKEGFRPVLMKRVLGGKVNINEIIIKRLSKEFPDKRLEFERAFNLYKENKKNNVKSPEYEDSREGYRRLILWGGGK